MSRVPKRCTTILTPSSELTVCTVIVLNACVPGYPLIVAANRDERYDRPSVVPLTMYQASPLPQCIRPWDEQAGGTWIGTANDGWIVAVTNQDPSGLTAPSFDPPPRSRGHVVNEALWDNNHMSVVKRLLSLDRRQYGPFNLLYGRPGAVLLTSVAEGRDLGVKVIDDGVTVVTNDCWGKLYEGKERRTKAMVEGLLARPIDALMDGMLRVLGDHTQNDGRWETAVCTHSPDDLHGTCSSSVITVSDEGHVEYRYSDGPPCQSKGLAVVGRLET